MKHFLLTVLFLPLLLAASFGCGRSESEAVLLRRAHDEGAAGRWNKALEPAERAARKAPQSPAAQIMLALACERNNQKDRAFDAARKAAALSPQNFLAQYTLGRLYAEDPIRQSEALPLLQKAAEIRPEDTGTQILLGNTLSALGRHKEALQYFTKLKSLHGTPEMQGLFGLHYAREGKFDFAIRAFAAAYNLAPRDPAAVYNMAVATDLYQRKPAQARTFYHAYLNVSGNDAAQTARRAEVSRRLAQLERNL